MSFRLRGGGRQLWPAVFLLVLLSACRGDAATQPPPQFAATQTVISTAGAAAFDSSPEATGSQTMLPDATSLPAPITATVFRLPSATPAPTQPEASPAPSATPTCQDGLLYLEDLTIPDGTVVPPGGVVDKRWRVQNSGSCSWDGRYRLRRISGEELGPTADQALFPARAGTEAVIRLLLTAPNEPGQYRSAWQAAGPQGEPFGDPIFVEIIVAASNP